MVFTKTLLVAFYNYALSSALGVNQLLILWPS